MKGLKVLIYSTLIVFVGLYLAFLFVLPYTINLNKYNSQITQQIQKDTGLVVELHDLKVNTAWDFSAGAAVQKMDLKYPTGEKFAQINNLKIRLSLVPLIFKKFEINKIEADKALFNLDIDRNGNFIINQYLLKEPPKELSMFTFSDKLPDIEIKKYRVSFLNRLYEYTLKGKDLKVSDFVLNKKIKISAKGNVILNGKKQISYDASVFTDFFPKLGKDANATEIIKLFDDLYKYKIKSKIVSDLKIKNKQNDAPEIDGNLDISRISFKFGEKVFPESNMKLVFHKNKAKINASLHVDETSKALITGVFHTGRNKFVDLHVASDKIDIQKLVLILKATARPLGIKSLPNITAKGLLKADFDIKSNFKEIESSGYLKIKNASITHNLYKVTLNAINADIDFSENSIHINKANAELNGQPIKIVGIINQNAMANLSVIANDLQLKGLLLTLGQTKMLKDNQILSGKVDVKASLKGRLDKPFCNLIAKASSINLKNRASKAHIKISQIFITADEKNGEAKISQIKIIPPQNSTISIPKLNLTFDKNNLKIPQNYIFIDNVRAIIAGNISNIQHNPTIKDLVISIPNTISVPIKGYAGSKAQLYGKINVKGNISNPKIDGYFNAPLINIPSLLTSVKNSEISFDNEIKVSCPNIKVANSAMKLNATINKDFSKGIVAKNVDFSADTVDLNFMAPILKNLTKSQGGLGLTILNGNSKIKKFKVGDIVSNNITSNISMNNNIFYLKNVFCDAYLGKVAGNINYNIPHRKIGLNLQGRGLSSTLALVAISGFNDDIHGQLDFDSNVTMSGFSERELLESVKGNTNFIISNGKMGILGKFEHLLYAQNIIANNIFRANLNIAAKAVTAKDTGVYKYMKGKITLSNGWAYINSIKTSGPTMSLYITGRCYLPDNTANLTILGRISDDVVRILGPIGDFSMDKMISYIPKMGEITAFFANQFTTNPNYENTSQIPSLTPKTDFKTKEFKVVIDGDIRKQSSVKTFKWLSHPKIIQAIQPRTSGSQTPHPAAKLPDFVKKLPDFKY